MDGIIDPWLVNILWILAAAGLGFLASFVFAGKLRLRRNLFLIPYVLLVSLLAAGYFFWSLTRIDSFFLNNLPWGIAAAVIISLFLIRNVFRQPASQRSKGRRLALEVVWVGGVYGSIDGALLSVIPVLATRNAFASLGWGTDIGTQVLVSIVAFGASQLVTVAYHLGYPEFRNRSIGGPCFGVAVMTIGYLITGSPLAALVSHTVMHVASVFRGLEKTAQCPPHYPNPASAHPTK